jgi:type I restriction enzyme, S subunit
MVTSKAAHVTQTRSAAAEPRVLNGYTLTDEGVIPDDWDVKPFQVIAHIERGKFTARPRNDPKYYGGDIPFIQTGDVSNANGQIITYSQTLNREGLKVSKLFPRGTLFFTIAANIGDVGFAAFDTACPDSLVAITPNNKIDKRWLAHELKSRKASFQNLATHNAQLNLNLEKLRPYLLPLPPPAEQEAIANVLCDADALIETLEQLIVKKRHIKQGALQELLAGRKRLPGFIGEWDTFVLGDLFSFKNGLNKAKKFFGYGTPIVNYMDVYKKRGLHATDLEGRVSVSNDELKAFQVRKGDVFFTRTSETAEEIGIASVMLDELEDTVFSGFLLRARPKDDSLDDQFKQYCFSIWTVREQITSQSTETTRALTNGRCLSRVKIKRPPRHEQTAIAAVLNDMETDITALEGKLAKARVIKQGMMQELLTGKIRLV